MAASYATLEDLYRHGLPRGSLVSRARLIASVDASANRLELEGHALVADAPCLVTVDAGGVLPAPLSALTIYYAKLVELESGVYSESLFQLAATPGGAAIDLTTAGTAPFRLHLSHVPTALAAIEYRSRWFDGFVSGNAVPLVEPYPVEAVKTVARAASIDLRRDIGLISDAQADASMASLAKDAERLMRGVPMRDADATVPTNLAVARSYSSGASSERTDTLP